MSYKKSVLLVEDDLSVAEALAHALKNDYHVTAITRGCDALDSAKHNNYDLIVLDLNLPDMSGLAVCQQLNSILMGVPVLILTAEASVLTKIKLLDAGASDYLTKPFSLGELKARLRVLQRQSFNAKARSNLDQLNVCGLTLDRASFIVIRGDQIIKLRRKEFALLECLMENAGLVVSRVSLAAFAWRDGDKPWTNSIDVHIKHLRDKIDRPFSDSLIKTVHGLGYKLVAP